MKKIFYILASAIVALGAVACDNQDLDNIAPAGEGLTISAVVDDTKVVFDGMTAKSWEKGDFITINGYKFDYVEGEHVFRCTTSGVESLVGEKFGATANELNPAKGIKGSTFVSVEDKVIENGVSFTFKLNSALVKYTTSETVTFKGTSVKGELAANKGTDQYVAVAAGAADFSYWVDGVQCKALGSDFEFKAGQIYNLGELDGPAKIYVYNADKTAETYIHAWIKGEEDFTKWPGENITSKTETIGNYKYNVYTLPYRAKGKKVSFVVNNGGDTHKSADFTVSSAIEGDKYLLFYKKAIEDITTTKNIPNITYLKPGGNWKQSNAKFGVHMWGDGSDYDALMTNHNDEGIYYIEVPNGKTSIIFVRLNSNATTFDWNKKWNQTGNLKLHHTTKYFDTKDWWDNHNDNMWTNF